MLDRHPALSHARDRRRLWRGRAAHLGFGILCALLGQGIAGWITGSGPAEQLVTLPVAIGLLLWLLSQVLREVVLLLRWPPRQPAQGLGMVGLLCSLSGFGAMLLPHLWLGWGLLGLAVLGLVGAGLRRRRAARVPPATSVELD